MQKVNTEALEEELWESPKGKFRVSGRQVSWALGRDYTSTDILKRHPFDVELQRVKPDSVAYPYHSHSAQWEFYLVLSGNGFVREEDGETPIGPNDAFIFKPGEAHQIRCAGPEELLLICVADNPIGESTYYPDTKRWSVRSPHQQLVRADAGDYLAGEE